MGNEASSSKGKTWENFDHLIDVQQMNNLKFKKILENIALLQGEQNQKVQQQIRNLQNEISTKEKIAQVNNNNHNYKKNSITSDELSQARLAWGNALIDISLANDQLGLPAATQIAKKVIDESYGYNFGPVLFKPTLTSGDHTFRITPDGALAYFVGQNPRFPNDTGFALKSWRQADIKTAAEFIDGDVAMWMGIVTLTDKNGNKVKVDKSWGYKKDKDGKLRIVLHHSSLPYLP
jgi:hypothetical protein